MTCSHLVFGKIALMAAWRRDPGKILPVTYRRGDGGTAREGTAAMQTSG